MKRVLSILISFISVGFLFTSCVKDYLPTQTNLDNLQSFLEMKTATDLGGGYNNIAGLANFTKANLVLNGTDPDTLYFYVNLASVNALNKDLTVSIGVDQNAFSNYAVASGDTSAYKLFPDSVYSLSTTSVTIPAGQHIAQAYVIFYPDKAAGLDPAQSYMLPVGVTDGSGVSVSANQGAIYYHSIGNPLAGNYLQDFYRWNDVADTTGAPNSSVFEGQPTSVSPQDPTTLILPESYLETFVGVGINLSFTNNDGVFSNFSVSVNESAITNAGFTINSGPTLVGYTIVGDASTHYAGSTFRTYMELTNSSGGNRKVVDNFVKQ